MKRPANTAGSTPPSQRFHTARQLLMPESSTYRLSTGMIVRRGTEGRQGSLGSIHNSLTLTHPDTSVNPHRQAGLLTARNRYQPDSGRLDQQNTNPHFVTNSIFSQKKLAILRCLLYTAAARGCNRHQRGVSSVVEHILHTDGVISSSLIHRICPQYRQQLFFKPSGFVSEGFSFFRVNPK